MKIYTGFGDKGQTALFGGSTVNKHDLRVECYGTIDELNSQLGFVNSFSPSPETGELILRIQNELFILGSEVATPDKKQRERFTDHIDAGHIEELEKTIDLLQNHLQPLKKFILPGGAPAAAACHVARTVCRRAERLLSLLNSHEQIEKNWLVYLNRLSDLLFVLARIINKESSKPDIVWQGIRSPRK
ncbi:MAG TPA: cob(I)yrinic acid a,c-diamide adenosyltransferase [Caldithrix abyssi]|uniref:Corrinoid adenosyltransferase n=1 Tax=Caldithrix abyssi TaxID=187145 RepID=A0A7V5RP63_CALAY|nr:cob(I)yrinic acid a,c-diamide adenosyltransferase [Caldithrix abyssi]